MPREEKCLGSRQRQLKVQPVFSVTPQGQAVDIRLDRFMRESANAAFDKMEMPANSMPDNGMHLIDFWAVDFDWRPDSPFNQHWQENRSRKNPNVAMVSDARFVYERPGNDTIAIKAIDTFGGETIVTVNAVST